MLLLPSAQLEQNERNNIWINQLPHGVRNLYYLSAQLRFISDSGSDTSEIVPKQQRLSAKLKRTVLPFLGGQGPILFLVSQQVLHSQRVFNEAHIATELYFCLMGTEQATQSSYCVSLHSHCHAHVRIFLPSFFCAQKKMLFSQNKI